MKAPDMFGSLIAAGITTMVGLQAIINIAVELYTHGKITRHVIQIRKNTWQVEEVDFQHINVRSSTNLHPIVTDKNMRK